MTKKNRKFKRETFGNMEVFHNIGPELGEAGERMLADIMNAAEYAVNTVKEKYPDVVKAVKTTGAEVADKASRQYANFKEEAEDAFTGLINTLQERAEADPDNTFLGHIVDIANEFCGIGTTNDDKFKKKCNNCECDTCCDKVEPSPTCRCKNKDKDTKIKCAYCCDDKCQCSDDTCEHETTREDRAPGVFAEALKARSQEDHEHQRFIKLMTERAWAFAKGENPVNTDWLYDDDGVKIGLVLTVYTNELHSTVKQTFDDVFGVRALCDQIAEILDLHPRNLKFVKIDDNQSVIKIRY